MGASYTHLPYLNRLCNRFQDRRRRQGTERKLRNDARDFFQLHYRRSTTSLLLQIMMFNTRPHTKGKNLPNNTTRGFRRPTMIFKTMTLQNFRQFSPLLAKRDHVRRRIGNDIYHGTMKRHLFFRPPTSYTNRKMTRLHQFQIIMVLNVHVS